MKSRKIFELGPFSSAERNMIITNLMIGFTTMLLCLIVQVAVSFWAVRYYVRQ